MSPAELTAVAALAGSVISGLTLIFAIVIYIQGRRAQAKAAATHDLVNSLAERDRKAAQADAFIAGRAAGTSDRLDALEKGKPPPAP